jgi:hypothetical protein
MSAGGVVHLQKKKVVKLETLAIVVRWPAWSGSRKTAMVEGCNNAYVVVVHVAARIASG